MIFLFVCMNVYDKRTSCWEQNLYRKANEINSVVVGGSAVVAAAHVPCEDDLIRVWWSNVHLDSKTNWLETHDNETVILLFGLWNNSSFTVWRVSMWKIMDLGMKTSALCFNCSVSSLVHILYEVKRFTLVHTVQKKHLHVNLLNVPQI